MSRTLQIAIVLMVLAAVMILCAGLMAWNTYLKIDGIGHLTRARTALLSQEPERAASEGRLAAQDMPGNSATVMMDTDLSDPASDQRLTHLENVCIPADRALVRATRALGQLVRNEAATIPSDDTADVQLLSAIAQMRAGTPLGEMPLPAHAQPHASVQLLYYIQEIRSAFASNDLVHLRDAAGALALLQPAHLDAQLLAFTASALAPTLDGDRLQRLCSNSAYRTRLVEFAQDLGHLVPDRASTLIVLAMGLQLNLPADQILNAEVKAAQEGKGVDPLMAVKACMEANRPDLAAVLVDKLPVQLQGLYARDIRNRSGDMAKLAQLGDKDAILEPRCSTPRIHDGVISFQLSNEMGALPRAGYSLLMDGVLVPADKIHRAGVIISLPAGSQPSAHLQVMAGVHQIFDGTVSL